MLVVGRVSSLAAPAMFYVCLGPIFARYGTRDEGYLDGFFDWC